MEQPTDLRTDPLPAMSAPQQIEHGIELHRSLPQIGSRVGHSVGGILFLAVPPFMTPRLVTSVDLVFLCALFVRMNCLALCWEWVYGPRRWLAVALRRLLFSIAVQCSCQDERCRATPNRPRHFFSSTKRVPPLPSSRFAM
jgi:hypothetical protein